MTTHRDLKTIIRERQGKTGESYTAARVHVMRDRAELLGLVPEEQPTHGAAIRVDGAVLKLNQRSARVRVDGEKDELTFRSGDLWNVAPGHVVTLDIHRRWAWGGYAYASGRVESARIDVARLGLTPLPLEGGELDDVRSHSEPYRSPDFYAPIWKRFTATPRPSFKFDGIAWGAFPGVDPEENPTCDAAELAEAGDVEGARELLMDVLGTDLRCLDAHAHLGNLEFESSAERAMVHYEIGMRIGELSLPASFDGFLVWGKIHNRPFLRCLHGYALCLWRLGRVGEARQVFERILALNPNDNQGVRFCWNDTRQGQSWAEMRERDAGGGVRRRRALH
jgi:tetratricopeptide (TPR) repeat protein